MILKSLKGCNRKGFWFVKGRRLPKARVVAVKASRSKKPTGPLKHNLDLRLHGATHIFLRVDKTPQKPSRWRPQVYWCTDEKEWTQLMRANPNIRPAHCKTPVVGVGLVTLSVLEPHSNKGRLFDLPRMLKAKAVFFSALHSSVSEAFGSNSSLMSILASLDYHALLNFRIRDEGFTSVIGFHKKARSYIMKWICSNDDEVLDLSRKVERESNDKGPKLGLSGKDKFPSFLRELVYPYVYKREHTSVLGLNVAAFLLRLTRVHNV